MKNSDSFCSKRFTMECRRRKSLNVSLNANDMLNHRNIYHFNNCYFRVLKRIEFLYGFFSFLNVFSLTLKENMRICVVLKTEMTSWNKICFWAMTWFNFTSFLQFYRFSSDCGMFTNLVCSLILYLSNAFFLK